MLARMATNGNQKMFLAIFDPRSFLAESDSSPSSVLSRESACAERLFLNMLEFLLKGREQNLQVIMTKLPW